MAQRRRRLLGLRLRGRPGGVVLAESCAARQPDRIHIHIRIFICDYSFSLLLDLDFYFAWRAYFSSSPNNTWNQTGWA